MKFKIYNTMSAEKEKFVPLMDEGKKDFVGIYTCGPTVYSTPHIGNLKSYIFADILRNTIKNLLGYPTVHVVNITDVGHLTDDCDNGEDKMEKAAKKEKNTCRDIAQKYENIFITYLEKINVELFDFFPRATEHIQQQIDLIKKIEEKGATYKTSDGVYMDTSKIKDYGKLIGKKHIEGLESGARIDTGEKRNSTDFALWKFSPENEKRQMEWDSPWGKGFPGWHIECSAMSQKYLGNQFDIHTGGYDHIPVHHTNEIAQSECANDLNQRVKYWMHLKFLKFKGEKFAKSTGNVAYLDDIIEKGFSPLDFRYFILSANYRHFQDFTWEILESKSKGYHNLIKDISSVYSDIGAELNKKQIENFDLLNTENPFIKGMVESLLDDLNTPETLAKINSFLGDIYSYKNEEIQENLKAIFALDSKVLKLNLFEETQQRVNEEIPQEIKEMAERRQQARKEKNFTEADKLREEIKQKGYEVKDTPDGYTLEKI